MGSFHTCVLASLDLMQELSMEGNCICMGNLFKNTFFIQLSVLQKVKGLLFGQRKAEEEK